MKRILVYFIVLAFLFSCEFQNDSVPTINKDITSQYLLTGNLDVFLANNQILRYKGKPGIVTIPIGKAANLSDYESCFILYVATGTTQETIVSSAIIKLDGLEVINTSDFSKNMGQHTFEICNLTPESVLSVEIRGEPSSYLDVWIEGSKVSNGMLVGYSFDGSLTDISGNLRSGIVQGSPQYSNGPMGRNQAASFDGTWRIVVDKSTSSDFSLADDWSMSFSVYPKTEFDWGNGFIQRFFRSYCPSGYGVIIFYSLYNQIGFQNNSLVNTYYNNELISDSWNRIILVHRANQTGDIYINGKLTKSNILMDISDEPSKKMSIGGNYRNEGCYGDGFANNILIDDFALFNRILSSSQITQDNLTSPVGF